MFSLFKWQKINFQTSQFNHFAFCCKSMTSSGHYVVKVFFFTCPTDPIWEWVQRIPSFFLYYCKQKFYNHFWKAWGFMLQNQGNMPWCLVSTSRLQARWLAATGGATACLRHRRRGRVSGDAPSCPPSGSCHCSGGSRGRRPASSSNRDQSSSIDNFRIMELL